MEKSQEIETPDPKAKRVKAKLSKEKQSKVHYLDFKKKDINNKNIKKNNISSNIILPTIDEKISELKPSIPVYFVRPGAVKRAANWFIANFKNTKNKTKILYSVKSNPEPSIVNYLYDCGLRHFDVASIAEVKLINGLFGDKVKLYYMHPMKPRESIFEAYFNYGIRDFSLDSAQELQKILEVTKFAKDLNLHLRLSVPNSHCAIDLSSKFGIIPSEAVSLARKIRSVAKNFGICFHVGSQCMDPVEYRSAIIIAKDLIKKAKVKLDVLDIGGGFPSVYPSMTPPNLSSYFNEIFDSINSVEFGSDVEIWCEPGRALVADSTSLLVRVEGRKGNMLYVNDGTYGGLFDAGVPKFIFPMRAIRTNKRSSLSSNMVSFGFYGPTCDSLDHMDGPFYLPENISEGDYIEIGQLGSYSRSIRTDFNGFSSNMLFEVSNQPMMSLYDSEDCEEAVFIKKN